MTVGSITWSYRSIIALAISLFACGNSASTTQHGKPGLQTGNIEVTLGDCTELGYGMVSGPRPLPLDPARRAAAERQLAVGTGTADYEQHHFVEAKAPDGGDVVSIGQAEVQGDLDRAIVRRYTKRKTQELQRCYVHAKRRVTGTVSARFIIGFDGRVESATASGFDPAVASCVAGVIKTIEFPKPKGDQKIRVNYPFIFRPGATEATATTTPPRGPSAPQPKRADRDDKLTGQAPPDMDYQPGSASPLRGLESELVQCLRAQPKRYGVAVIDLGKERVAAHGLSREFEDCVARLGDKLPNAKPQRCSLAFGPMPVTEARGVDITADAIAFEGTKIGTVGSLDASSIQIPALVARAEAHVTATRASSAPVVLHGPIVVRAIDSAPMKAVTRVYLSLIAAGEDPVLAAQHDGGWALLDDIGLPVVPVPLGTGGSWRPVRRDDPDPKLSVLVTKGGVWVGISRVNEFTKVELPGALESELRKQRQSLFFLDRRDIEIAGDDAVNYREVVKAIEAAKQAGFTQWELVAPTQLSADPTVAR